MDPQLAAASKFQPLAEPPKRLLLPRPILLQKPSQTQPPKQSQKRRKPNSSLSSVELIQIEPQPVIWLRFGFF